MAKTPLPNAPRLAVTSRIIIGNRSPAPKPPVLRQPRQAPKIKAAIQALWPDGIPAWLSPARRNWEIANWVWEKGEPIPSDRTIRHVLRRLE